MNVAVIGASSGLGAAIAVHHCRRGDNVVAVARRMERLEALSDALQHAAEDDVTANGATDSLAPRNGWWVSFQADISSGSSQQQLVDSLADCDRIYLVAGVNADPRSTFETNTLGPIRIAQAIDRPGLQLVVISSLAAVVAFPDLATYCASKAALEQWMACWRSIAQAHVFVVRPGQFHSDFHSGPRPLDFERLPLPRAIEVVRLADHHRTGLRTIGWRDRVAALGARLAGPNHALRLL